MCIVLVILLISCGKKEITVNLDVLSMSKIDVFRMISYRPGEMDYTYCDDFSDLVDVRLEEVNGEKRIVVVCLAVDSTNRRSLERSRYFKYSWITPNGKIQFCGWRDNKYKLKENGDVRWNDSEIGTSGKCAGFRIYRYSHK